MRRLALLVLPLLLALPACGAAGEPESEGQLNMMISGGRSGEDHHLSVKCKDFADLCGQVRKLQDELEFGDAPYTMDGTCARFKLGGRVGGDPVGLGFDCHTMEEGKGAELHRLIEADFPDFLAQEPAFTEG